MIAIYITVTGSRTFSVGPGAPVTGARIDTEVTMPPIRASADIESQPDSFDIDMVKIPGLAAMFWPPPIGAVVSIHRSADASEIARGTLTGISISRDSLQAMVQL